MRTIISSLPNRGNFHRGKYTVEIGYPWLSYGAIIAIEQNLKPTHNVLEFGCGGSTIFFSRRCNTVKSYEIDSEWVEKVKTALSDSLNVSFVCKEKEALIESIRTEQDERYDWLLSDIGSDYKFRLRVMNESIPKLKKGGYMIVDNYQAHYIARFDYTGWDVYRFDDFGHHFTGTIICVKP